MTATQLIYQALRDIGCLRPGGTTSTDVNNDALVVLNQLIDDWQIDRLMIYTTTASIFQLVAGQQQYTIGPSGAQFVAPRPVYIEEANIILNTVNPVIRYALEVIRDPAQWASIAVQQLPFAIPNVLYPQGDFVQPFGYSTLNLWPGPQSSYQLELYVWQQLQSFADLTTNYTFPPGYANCMRKNLAVALAPMMKVYFKIPEPLLQEVARQAMVSKDMVMSYNAPNPVMPTDPAFMGQSARQGAWNYGTGLVGRRNG